MAWTLGHSSQPCPAKVSPPPRRPSVQASAGSSWRRRQSLPLPLQSRAQRAASAVVEAPVADQPMAQGRRRARSAPPSSARRQTRSVGRQQGRREDRRRDSERRSRAASPPSVGPGRTGRSGRWFRGRLLLWRPSPVTATVEARVDSTLESRPAPPRTTEAASGNQAFHSPAGVTGGRDRVRTAGLVGAGAKGDKGKTARARAMAFCFAPRAGLRRRVAAVSGGPRAATAGRSGPWSPTPPAGVSRCGRRSCGRRAGGCARWGSAPPGRRRSRAR